MTKKNALKLLVMLGLAFLTICIFSSNVNATESTLTDKEIVENIITKYNGKDITKIVNLGDDIGSRVDYAIEYLNKEVNDSTITFERNGMGDGGSGSLGLTGGGAIGLDIYKNNVKYGDLAIHSYFQYQIIIPSSVENTEEAHKQYAISKLQEFFNTSEKIGIEKLNGDEYKVYYEADKETYDTILIKIDNTETVETLLESKGFYFDTEANMYRSPKFDRYINLENANTVEISETYVIDTLTKYLNDNSIKISYIGYGGDITGGTATCNLYKDNNYYGVICFDFNNILEIIVPDNVGNTDNAIIDYGINKIKNTLLIKDDISLNKISGYWYEINPYGSKAIVKKVEGTHIGNNIFADNLDEGVTITVTEKQNATMENEIKNKGYANILGSYELTLEGATELSNPINVTFNLGTEYNGKTIYILHQKKDGSFEDFEEKVVDGKVTITVSELSPFVLAVKENNTQTETPQDEQTQDTTNEHIKDETPKTGNNDISTIVFSILSVLSAAGIAIVKKF